MATASPITHLIIADAALPLPVDQPQPAWPELPELGKLLRTMEVGQRLQSKESDPATPLERVWSAALGWSGASGQMPWAAHETGTFGTACAWFRPCHWQIGMNEVMPLAPEQLDLSESESRALMQTLQPLLLDEGLQLDYVAPTRWLATGPMLANLTTTSIGRARHGGLTRDRLVQAADSRQKGRMQRLQAEMEMTIYNHSVNDAREQAHRWPVHSIWIEGAGMLPGPLTGNVNIQLEQRLERLADPIHLDNFQQTWCAIDQDTIATLRHTQAHGSPVQLSLCGPSGALTFVEITRPWHRLVRRFQRVPLDELQAHL